MTDLTSVLTLVTFSMASSCCWEERDRVTCTPFSAPHHIQHISPRLLFLLAPCLSPHNTHFLNTRSIYRTRSPGALSASSGFWSFLFFTGSLVGLMFFSLYWIDCKIDQFLKLWVIVTFWHYFVISFASHILMSHLWRTNCSTEGKGATKNIARIANAVQCHNSLSGNKDCH